MSAHTIARPLARDRLPDGPSPQGPGPRSAPSRAVITTVQVLGERLEIVASAPGHGITSCGAMPSRCTALGCCRWHLGRARVRSPCGVGGRVVCPYVALRGGGGPVRERGGPPRRRRDAAHSGPVTLLGARRRRGPSRSSPRPRLALASPSPRPRAGGACERCGRNSGCLSGRIEIGLEDRGRHSPAPARSSSDVKSQSHHVGRLGALAGLLVWSSPGSFPLLRLVIAAQLGTHLVRAAVLLALAASLYSARLIGLEENLSSLLLPPRRSRSVPREKKARPKPLPYKALPII